MIRLSEPRDFEKDLKESNDWVLRNEWIRVCKEIWGETSIVSFKDGLEVQKGLGTDSTVQQSNGRRFSVEFKSKRFDLGGYDSWLLEVKHNYYPSSDNYWDKNKRSCIGGKEGWLYTTTAEFIVYATLSESKKKIIEVCAFSLDPFKYEHFNSEITKLKKTFASTQFKDKFQVTINAIAPTQWLKENARDYWYWREE